MMNTNGFKWTWDVPVLFLICLSSVSVASVVPNTFNNSVHYPSDYKFQDPEYTLSPQGRSYRQSKFFPLFTIIRFTNEVCRTTSEEAGICYTKSQCSAAGGIPQGNCAQGLGVCCRFVAGCGSIITQNGTSFQNPNYPSKYNPNEGATVCQVRIRRQHNVCQLRLNFIAFDIDGPNGVPSTAGTGAATNDAGTCKTDSLAVTASGGTIPNLCGNMAGSHIYVDYGSSDTITLNLLLSGNTFRERTWNIEILMIPCNSLSRAPTGCLQYHTGISGQARSFNFQGGAHLANMDYSICVRPEDGMRFIDWTPCQPGDVKISGGTTSTTPTAPAVCAAAGLVDYITIMGGIAFPLAAAPTNGIILSTTDRFCDTTWPQAVTSAYVRSSVRPFILHFKTDGTESTTATAEGSIGFCLRWQQNPQ